MTEQITEESALVERVAEAIKPTLFRLYPRGRSSSHEEAREMARRAIAAMSTSSPVKPVEQSEGVSDDALVEAGRVASEVGLEWSTYGQLEAVILAPPPVTASGDDLRAENERLREALRQIEALPIEGDGDDIDFEDGWAEGRALPKQIARAALSEQEGE